jgi:NADPH-dependent glutamate synthase beta subunit-like oxidoreductase
VIGEVEDEAERPLEVVVVGSGPAGIGAAWELVQGGALVTVLERDSEPGGLLRWAIPEFVLPRELVARPWQALQEAGVTLWCDVEVTPQRMAGMRSRFDAVVMGHGAAVPRRRPFEGDRLDGVWDAARFLRLGGEAAAAGKNLSQLLGRPLPAGRPPTVIVAGAGNTGMDVSRLALRLGARAVCIGRADRERTAVRPEELAVAEAEGVEVRFRTALVQAIGPQGKVVEVVLVATRPDGTPPSGRRLQRDAESEGVDLVVLAQGSRTDPSWDDELPGIPVRAEGLLPLPGDDFSVAWRASGLLGPEVRRPRGITPDGLRVGWQSLRREQSAARAGEPVRGWVWVVGDASTGPATVVEAMVAGRRAAAEILRRGPVRHRGVQPGGGAGLPVVPGAAAGLPLPRGVPGAERAGARVFSSGMGVPASSGDPSVGVHRWNDVWAGALRSAGDTSVAGQRSGRRVPAARRRR